MKANKYSYMWLSFLSLTFMGFIWLTATILEEIAQAQSNQDITVSMYVLTPTGGNTEVECIVDDPEDPEDEADLRRGCTAFNQEDYPDPSDQLPYPYNTNPVTVPIEDDYLLDVVPQEMMAGAPQPALKAQAVAARTYAYWHINQESDITNAINFQAFIPYRFENLQVGVDPDNSDDLCASTNLNNDQTNVCDAVDGTNGMYLAYGAGYNPVNAEFRAENGNPTNPCPDGQGNCPPLGETCPGLAQAGFGLDEYPHLKGVADPISAGWARTQADCNSVGLNQRGAMRWTIGNTCAPGQEDNCDVWGVTWTDYRQILVHYYTGINIERDAGGWFDYGAPKDRWNLLNHTIPTEMESNQSYTVTLVLQNTSTRDWDYNDVLAYRWTGGGVSPYDGNYDEWQIIYLVPPAMGEAITITESIDIPSEVDDYDLHWDMVLYEMEAGGVWFLFGENNEWPHYVMPITVTSSTPPTPTPSPTNTPTPTPTFTPSATPTPTNTPLPPTNTPQPTPTHTPAPPTSTPTPNPCFVTTAMQDAPETKRTSTLKLLRQVRDEFLTTEAAGRPYIDLYNRHSPEITRLLLKDQKLRLRVQSLLSEMLPVVEPLVQPQVKAKPLTREQVKAVDEILLAVQRQASPELSAEIGYWREQIKSWVGLTSPEIWEELKIREQSTQMSH